MNKDWRATQKSFFEKNVEFAQDKRILDFFSMSKKISTYGYGNISYFKNEINFVNNLKSYEQALLIFDVIIEKNKLLEILFNIKKKLKNNAKVCISINKFLVYTDINQDQVPEDYDIAILELITNIFSKKIIKHYFIKDLKGRHFNFASPTTQFFII